jgi:hypothetical protein
MYMPVAPAYGTGNGGMDGFGFGGGWWLILLLICLGGWNNGFGGGFGGGNGAFPWIMNGQAQGYSDVQRGFDQNAIMTGLSGIQGAVTSGFGDVQTALCGGFAGVNAGIANGFAQAEIANNARQIADMQQNFGIQTAISDCCCKTQSGLGDVKYTIATEACNTRAANTANTQAILDKLCQLELDGVKSELANANNTINQLRTQLLVSNNEASQVAQTAAILAGQNAEVDALYNRLNSCPVPTTPVYGRTPIFTCGNGGCGCGMAA